MNQLRIDNEAKTITAELLLEGEAKPITVEVSGYVLSGGELRFSAISVSRPWMDRLAQELLAGKPLPIPPSVGKWLRLIM